ncbi:hypothetical protein HDU96_001332, partial [Phlyctochytrium bullatum]
MPPSSMRIFLAGLVGLSVLASVTVTATPVPGIVLDRYYTDSAAAARDLVQLLSHGRAALGNVGHLQLQKTRPMAAGDGSQSPDTQIQEMQ